MTWDSELEASVARWLDANGAKYKKDFKIQAAPTRTVDFLVTYPYKFVIEVKGGMEHRNHLDLRNLISIRIGMLEMFGPNVPFAVVTDTSREQAIATLGAIPDVVISTSDLPDLEGLRQWFRRSPLLKLLRQANPIENKLSSLADLQELWADVPTARDIYHGSFNVANEFKEFIPVSMTDYNPMPRGYDTAEAEKRFAEHLEHRMNLGTEGMESETGLGKSVWSIISKSLGGTVGRPVYRNVDFPPGIIDFVPPTHMNSWIDQDFGQSVFRAEVSRNMRGKWDNALLTELISQARLLRSVCRLPLRSLVLLVMVQESNVPDLEQTNAIEAAGWTVLPWAFRDVDVSRMLETLKAGRYAHE